MVLLAAADPPLAVQTSVLAAAVSLLVALIALLGGARRDRSEHRYQRRRTALLDVQDAALTLRLRLSDYGETSRRTHGQPGPDLAEAERQFDHARGRVQVMLSRVEDRTVTARVTDWEAMAQISFISTEDMVTSSAEETAWVRVNAAIGAALASRNGSTDRRPGFAGRKRGGSAGRGSADFQRGGSFGRRSTRS